MTKKEEHEPGNLGYCKKCGHSIWNREPCPNTMKAPQQQPDEGRPYLGMGQGVPYEGRLSPQEAAESFSPHSQQTEQWMEERRKEIEDVFYAECDLLSLDGYRKIPATVVRDDKRFIDRLLTLLQSQIEAARREEREKVYADLNAYGERVMSEAKAKEWENLPPLNEEVAKKLIEGIKSLTNHN